MPYNQQLVSNIVKGVKEALKKIENVEIEPSGKIVIYGQYMLDHHDLALFINRMLPISWGLADPVEYIIKTFQQCIEKYCEYFKNEIADKLNYYHKVNSDKASFILKQLTKAYEDQQLKQQHVKGLKFQVFSSNLLKFVPSYYFWRPSGSSKGAIVLNMTRENPQLCPLPLSPNIHQIQTEFTATELTYQSGMQTWGIKPKYFHKLAKINFNFSQAQMDAAHYSSEARAELVARFLNENHLPDNEKNEFHSWVTSGSMVSLRWSSRTYKKNSVDDPILTNNKIVNNISNTTTIINLSKYELENHKHGSYYHLDSKTIDEIYKFIYQRFISKNPNNPAIDPNEIQRKLLKQQAERFINNLKLYCEDAVINNTELNDQYLSLEISNISDNNKLQFLTNMATDYLFTAHINFLFGKLLTLRLAKINFDEKIRLTKASINDLFNLLRVLPDRYKEALLMKEFEGCNFQFLNEASAEKLKGLGEQKFINIIELLANNLEFGDEITELLGGVAPSQRYGSASLIQSIATTIPTSDKPIKILISTKNDLINRFNRHIVEKGLSSKKEKDKIMLAKDLEQINIANNNAIAPTTQEINPTAKKEALEQIAIYLNLFAPVYISASNSFPETTKGQIIDAEGNPKEKSLHQLKWQIMDDTIGINFSLKPSCFMKGLIEQQIKWHIKELYFHLYPQNSAVDTGETYKRLKGNGNSIEYKYLLTEKFSLRIVEKMRELNALYLTLTAKEKYFIYTNKPIGDETGTDIIKIFNEFEMKLQNNSEALNEFIYKTLPEHLSKEKDLVPANNNELTDVKQLNTF